MTKHKSEKPKRNGLTECGVPEAVPELVSIDVDGLGAHWSSSDFQKEFVHWLWEGIHQAIHCNLHYPLKSFEKPQNYRAGFLHPGAVSKTTVDGPTFLLNWPTMVTGMLM